MSSSFPELLLSLTLQTTVLILVARLLTSGLHDREAADRLWGHCHVLVLLLSVIAVMLPHLRLLRSDAVLSVVGRVTSNAAFDEFALSAFLIWIAGAGFLSIRVTVSLILTSLQVRRSQLLTLSVDNSNLRGISTETCTHLETLEVRVYRSDECPVPFCWQLHVPVIVLPDAMMTFPSGELDAVLRHELAHLQSQHPLLLFLQRMVEILFWFNPLVWSASREASLQRELAADRLANRSSEEAAVFLKSIVRLSEERMTMVSGLAAGMGFGGHGASMIQQRVEHLLSMKWSKTQSTSLRLRTMMVLLFTTVLASALWVPLNSRMTERAFFSPWPQVSATVLHEMGISVRDYEIDSHRLEEVDNGRE